MGSGKKKKTTMAKLSRESRLRERRVEKAAKKAARKLASTQEPSHEHEHEHEHEHAPSAQEPAPDDAVVSSDV